MFQDEEADVLYVLQGTQSSDPVGDPSVDPTEEDPCEDPTDEDPNEDPMSSVESKDDRESPNSLEMEISPLKPKEVCTL